MAREGITFEQVSAAAEDLLKTGQQPTIRAIRERLGTGSPNTIHKHLTTWRASLPAPNVGVFELPRQIQFAIIHEIERATADVRTQIELRLTEAMNEAAELAVSGEQLEIERDQLIEKIAAVTRERDTFVGKSEQQAAELAAQAETIQRQHAVVESVRIEAATARLKVEVQTDRIVNLEAEIDRVRAVVNAAQQARGKAEQEAAVTAAKLVGSEAQLSQQSIELNRLRAAVDAGQEARGALEKSQQSIQALKEELAVFKSKLDNSLAYSEIQAEELTRLRSSESKNAVELETLRHSAAVSQQSVSELEQQAAAVNVGAIIEQKNAELDKLRADLGAVIEQKNAELDKLRAAK